MDNAKATKGVNATTENRPLLDTENDVLFIASFAV